MRRVTILVLLYLGMQLVLPLGRGGPSGPLALLVFGFLILGAYTVGELATLARLPKITGYLFAGMIFGPSLLAVVPAPVVTELAPITELAVALIAFLAGAELRWSELRERARTILGLLGVELLLSFIVIADVILGLQRWVPFLKGADGVQVLVLTLLFSAVAIVHSPAVMIALLSETKAKGPVARTTLGIVLVADVVVVLVFSGALALARAIAPGAGSVSGLSVGVLSWELGGSLIIGGILGGAIGLYLRFVQRELVLFAIVIAFFGAEIARLLHVETLLTLLVAGFVTENATKRGGAELLQAMERSAAPVFVVFFALAGASIDLRILATIWPLALAVVAARMLAIWSGCRIGSRLVNAPPVEESNVWMGLVAQAGVAIGLVTVISNAYPARGPMIGTLLLSVIAINQIIGPVLSRFALVRSGEVESAAAASAPQSARATPSR